MTMTQAIMRKELLTAIIDGSKPVAKVEIQEVTMKVGIDAPLHLHPCPTVGVFTEGQIAFEIEGAQTQILKVGDAFYEPADIRVAKFNEVIHGKFILEKRWRNKKPFIHKYFNMPFGLKQILIL